MAVFYDKTMWPNDLRFESDGGEDLPDRSLDEGVLHPAVSLFKLLGDGKARQKHIWIGLIYLPSI
jgi:hypothetical protein